MAHRRRPHRRRSTARPAGPACGASCGGPDADPAALSAVASAAVTALAERLGYSPDDRLLIVNCDDLGSSHAANVGVYEACATASPPAPP